MVALFVFLVFTAVSVFLFYWILLFLFRLAREIWRYYKAKRKLLEMEEVENRRYRANPDMLRGHDLVAAMWFDRIRGSALPDHDAVSLVVAAGTAMDHKEGRRYDGRPIQQGWMTKEDFDAYFRFLDSFGDAKSRYEVIYKANACELMDHLGVRGRVVCDREARSRCGSDLGMVSDWLRKTMYVDVLLNTPRPKV